MKEILKVRKKLGFIHSVLTRLRRKKTTKARKTARPAPANAKKVNTAARANKRERNEATKKKAVLPTQLKKVEAARKVAAHAAAAAKKHPGSSHHLMRAQEKALAHHEATLKAYALMQEQVENELAKKPALLKEAQRKEQEAAKQAVKDAARKAKEESAAKAKTEKEAKLLVIRQEKEEAARKKAIAKQQAATKEALKKILQQEAKEQAAHEKEVKRLVAQQKKEEAALTAKDAALATHVDTSAVMTVSHEFNKADAPEGWQLSEDEARQQHNDAAEGKKTIPEDKTKGDAKKEKASEDITPDGVKVAKEAALAPKKGSYMINTELDELVEIVNARQTTTILSLAHKLGLSPDRVEHWCAKLDEKGIIKLQYPVIGPAIVSSLVNKKAAAKAHTGHVTLIRVILTILVVLLTATVLWRYYGGQ